MTHTTRIYNRKGRHRQARNGRIKLYLSSTFEFYHPYRQLCCGNCKRCKDPMISKRRRLTYKHRMNREVKEVQS